MRRWMIALLAAALVMAFAPVALAEGHLDDDGGGTYLALGDSVAAGTQQPLPFTDNGYADRLFKKLEGDYGFDKFVNLACPADDSAEMLDGNASTGSLCYGDAAVLPPGGTSQLDAAVAYLTAHPGEVKLITIVVGANDIFVCDPNAADFQVCLGAQFQSLAGNLGVILGTLQAVAPGVPIVGMNYYQPNLAYWHTGPEGQALAEASLQLTRLGNDEVLQPVYDFFGVPVVDVAAWFKTYQTAGNPPRNVRWICKLTLMCERQGRDYVLSDYDPVTPGPQTDIHPSNKGHKRIANAHIRLIDKYNLLGG